MKKTILAFLLIFAALGVFAQNGVLREISGTVELKGSGASSFVPAAVGDQVGQDTIISTGFKSTALVEIGSTLIAVRPLTRLTLTEIRASTGAETLNVNLSAGRVVVDVNPPAGTRASMSVSSPSATASVRGTKFKFDLMNLEVYEGNVLFGSSKGGYSYMVGTRTFGRMGPDGNPIDPVFGYLTGLKPKSPVGSGKATGNDEGEPTSNSSGPEGSINVGLLY